MLAALDIYSVLLFVALGSLAGFLGGLIGIGGGFVLVPGFYYAFARMGIAPGHELTLALGTAMAGILFAASGAARAHARNGAVRGDMVRSLAPWAAAGAMAGASMATILDASVVKFAFAAFCLFSASRWLFVKPREEPQRVTIDPAEPAFVGPMPQEVKRRNQAPGMLFGTICGLIGVGGANLFVPFLMTRKMGTRQAMATASALQIPIAIAGALAYMALGWAVDNAPGTLGFIYVPALLAAGAASFLAAPLGARLSRVMPVPALRKTFGLITAVIGLKMAGAFAYLASVFKVTPWF